MQKIKNFYIKLISSLNIYCSKFCSSNIYFFIIKYIYPLLILKKIDFSLKFKNTTESNNFFFVGSNKSADGYFCELNRANRYVGGGFDSVGNYLFKQYQIDKLKLENKDIVIEVGANIGELSRFFLNLGVYLYLFEVEKKMLDCLKLNCKNYSNYQCYNEAAWNKDDLLQFLSDTKGASSSLIYSNEKQNLNICKYVKATKLDTFIEKKKISFIKLVKIEAEGGEPEVLEGLQNSLSKIKYITADCGPERLGKGTLNQVKTILEKNNFDIELKNNCCLGINRHL